MATHYKTHIGHRLTYFEPVEQQWAITWEDGEPRRTEVTDETVLDIYDKLYCYDCDLFLTDFDATVI